MDKGTWWPTVHGVAKSWTQLSNLHTHTHTHTHTPTHCLDTQWVSIERYQRLQQGDGRLFAKTLEKHFPIQMTYTLCVCVCVIYITPERICKFYSP